METSVCLGDNKTVIDNIVNELFDSSRDWYAEEEFDSVGKLVYRPPPFSDVWFDERGRCEQKEELGKQRNRQEQEICERNMSVPETEIISHYTKNDPPPTGAPISDVDSTDDDSFVESTHAESEGDVYEDVAQAATPTTFPPEAPNIYP